MTMTTGKAFSMMQPGAHLAKQPRFTVLISIGKQKGCMYETHVKTESPPGGTADTGWE